MLEIQKNEWVSLSEAYTGEEVTMIRNELPRTFLPNLGINFANLRIINEDNYQITFDISQELDLIALLRERFTPEIELENAEMRVYISEGNQITEIHFNFPEHFLSYKIDEIGEQVDNDPVNNGATFSLYRKSNKYFLNLK